MNLDMKDKPRLAISFSGGRSSAVMLRLCLLDYRFSHDIRITFANTGQEHEETLRFVDAVDRNFCKPMGYSVTWIEAVTMGPGKGPQAKVVTYETASRDGEPFEAAIAKHGVFCKSHPGCTEKIKTEPMKWFLKSQGWNYGTYDTAIGIRHDERFLRESASAKENRIIYPLFKMEWNKRMVNLFMEQFDWDLNLPSDAYGNCVGCFKKSNRKLMTVAKTNPEFFDFFGRMERKYGMVNKGNWDMTEPRVFFRENRSAQDILKAAQTERFEPYEDDKFDQREFFDDFLDAGTSCGETCEIYGE
jgi:3'-phosphoadenosine 5'-phosphosulfate sulfotransferase (PAPS reductase)/FAD synthetase